MSITRTIAGVVLVGWVGGCAALGGSGTPGSERELSRYEVTRPMMGTGVRVVLYASDEAAAQAAVDAAFARGGMLEARFTDYNASSELSLLSQTAASGGGAAVHVSDDLYDMLSVAERWSYRTGGAFDVTVGPIVRLWRRARRTGELPDADRLREALAATGYLKMRIDPLRRTVRLNEPNMRLDLGGIAKGYIADAMLAELGAHGIDRALVDAGGNVVVSGAPPGKDGWVVALMPMAADGEGGSGVRFVTLTHGAVASSGDAFQHVVIDGVRYSHIVDPSTGLGLTTPIAASVVVLDIPGSDGRGSGATADALSTSMCVMGAKRGLKLIEATPGTAAMIVVNTGDGAGVYASASLGELHVTDEPAP